MAIPTTRALLEGNTGRIGWANYPGSVAINLLDMLYLDSSGNIQPATALAHGATNKADQLTFAANFIGLAGAAKLSTDVADPYFPVITDGVFDMVCASASPAIGDLVAISNNGSNNGVLNDTVIKSTDPATSIGRVLMPGSSVSLMRCRLTSRLLANDRAADGVFGEIVQSCPIASFSDDGGTSGHLDTTDKLPAGAVVLGWTFNCTGIFGGDTTATIKAGTSGSVGAFSADPTQSVFTTGVKGSASAAATSFNASEASVRITVTGSADFTSIVGNATGAGTFKLRYWVPNTLR